MATIEIFPRVIGKYTLEKERHLQLKEQCFSLLKDIENDESVLKRNAQNSKLNHYLNRENQNLLDYANFDWFEIMDRRKVF